MAAGFVEGKNLDSQGQRGTKQLSRPDKPKEELPSLVGRGRYWDQSGIRLTNIKLYADQPVFTLVCLQRTSTSGILVPSTTNSGSQLASDLGLASALHSRCVTLFRYGDARLWSCSCFWAGALCWAAILGFKTLSTRLKALMAVEAAADDAHRNAVSHVAARMMKLKDYRYLKTKYCKLIWE